MRAAVIDPFFFHLADNLGGAPQPYLWAVTASLPR
jgi:hypothetical protein